MFSCTGRICLAIYITTPKNAAFPRKISHFNFSLLSRLNISSLWEIFPVVNREKKISFTHLLLIHPVFQTHYMCLVLWISLPKPIIISMNGNHISIQRTLFEIRFLFHPLSQKTTKIFRVKLTYKYINEAFKWKRVLGVRTMVKNYLRIWHLLRDCLCFFCMWTPKPNGSARIWLHVFRETG